MSEPLASPTLALLYLAQGHRSRAAATLDEVLELEPSNGYALALRERMRARPRPELTLRFVASSAAGVEIGAGELELRWAIPPELREHERRFDVVIALATRRRPSLHYTSIPCLDREAVQRIPAPLGPASVAAVLVARSPFELLAVAAPMSW
jgi:hypothetical protein